MIAEQLAVEPFQIIVVAVQTLLVESIVGSILFGSLNFQRFRLGSGNFDRFGFRSLDFNWFSFRSLYLNRL